MTPVSIISQCLLMFLHRMHIALGLHIHMCVQKFTLTEAASGGICAQTCHISSFRTIVHQFHPTGLPLVREKSGKFGIGRGNLEFWELEVGEILNWSAKFGIL